MFRVSVHRKLLLEKTEQERIKFQGFDEESIAKLEPYMSLSMLAIQKMAGKGLHFPKKVIALSDKEIEDGEVGGAGHGMFVPPGTVKVNPKMPLMAILIAFTHELLHWQFGANEIEIDQRTRKIFQEMGLLKRTSDDHLLGAESRDSFYAAVEQQDAHEMYQYLSRLIRFGGYSSMAASKFLHIPENKFNELCSAVRSVYRIKFREDNMGTSEMDSFQTYMKEIRKILGLGKEKGNY